MGKSKVTPELSLEMENYLGINHPGFFYKIQANYDVTLPFKNKRKKATPEDSPHLYFGISG